MCEGMVGTARPSHPGGRAPVGNCLRWRRSRVGRVTPTQCRGSSRLERSLIGKSPSRLAFRRLAGRRPSAPGIRRLEGPCGQGVSVWLPSSQTDRIASLAEQMQSWKLDELDPTGQCREPWPECPLHPVRHSLDPDDRPGVPVWCCPESCQVIAEIGSLGSPLPEGIPRFVQAE